MIKVSKDVTQMSAKRNLLLVASVALVGAVYLTIRADKLWSLHSQVYTAVVLVMGAYVLSKRKDKYVRSMVLSLMFFQLFLFYIITRFVLPEGFGMSGYPWPLYISALSPKKPGWILTYFVIYSFIFIPIVTYVWGRRVYCNWICTRGALAETLGDPFRRRAPKGRLSRRLEVLAYVILLIAIVATVLIWMETKYVSRWYFLGMTFPLELILGLALYPSMGGRIWCRYFCPLGAIVGAISKRGRFAIVGDKEQCNHCGECTAVCEMGINVQRFVNQGEELKSRHCTGCGICISQCPTNALWFKSS